MNRDPQINDAYFRRLFIPIVITLLLLCGIAVILSTPPGTPMEWNTYFQATPLSFPFSK
jgi:hypothetical protein